MTKPLLWGHFFFDINSIALCLNLRNTSKYAAVLRGPTWKWRWDFAKTGVCRRLQSSFSSFFIFFIVRKSLNSVNFVLFGALVTAKSLTGEHVYLDIKMSKPCSEKWFCSKLEVLFYAMNHVRFQIRINKVGIAPTNKIKWFKCVWVYSVFRFSKYQLFNCGWTERIVFWSIGFQGIRFFQNNPRKMGWGLSTLAVYELLIVGVIVVSSGQMGKNRRRHCFFFLFPCDLPSDKD